MGGGPSIQRLNADLGSSTVEETALVVEALFASNESRELRAAERGTNWLLAAIEDGELEMSRPIGFYFAKLWYDEKHYPRVFALGALSKALRHYSCE